MHDCHPCTSRDVQQYLCFLSVSLQEVGEVTSGAYSPCLKKNIAMGYVKKGHDKVGTKLKLVVRGKQNDAEVVKMPFVPTHYYKG
jgi:aminomethyltransferase